MSDPIRRAITRGLIGETEQMSGLAERVVAQAEARVIHGDTHFEDKIVSVFEPETEIIRKGKASQPTEFGKMIKIQEAEKRVSIPNRRTRSPARVKHQRERWFTRGQRWRVGCEGRISVAKRRHGLARCRYRRPSGMERWVGLGVIANNLIVIGNHRAKKRK